MRYMKSMFLKTAIAALIFVLSSIVLCPIPVLGLHTKLLTLPYDLLQLIEMIINNPTLVGSVKHHDWEQITNRNGLKLLEIGYNNPHINVIKARNLLQFTLNTDDMRSDVVVYVSHEKLQALILVRELYKRQRFNLLWNTGSGLLPEASSLLNLLYKEDPLSLLKAGGYHLMTIDTILEGIDRKKPGEAAPEQIVELDILLTDALVQYFLKNTPYTKAMGQKQIAEMLTKSINLEDITKDLLENLRGDNDRGFKDLDSSPQARVKKPYILSKNHNPTEIKKYIYALLNPSQEIEREGKAANFTIINSKLVKSFYGRNDFQPAWIDKEGLSGDALNLIKTLSKSPNEGLVAEDYQLENIKKLLRKIVNLETTVQNTYFKIAHLELLLTDAFFTYASHLLGERSPIQQIFAKHIGNRPQANLISVLSKSLESNLFGITLSGLAPMNKEYLGLRKMLSKYKDIQKSKGWGTVSRGKTLRIGDRGERVLELRRRLSYTDPYIATPPVNNNKIRRLSDPLLFDEALKQAVIRFRKRHGLPSEGVVGPKTLKSLNISIDEKIEQIRVNMERWCWYNRVLSDSYIIVNAADFSLKFVEKNKNIIRLKTVIGNQRTKTPVLISEIQHLVLNPYWYAPESIAKGIIEPPGPKNPLGKVKFMFPNNQSIYLHDTPEKHLFNKHERTFSHGCVRVEDAVTLAQHLIKFVPGWSSERIQKKLKSNKTQWLTLKEPVPIYLLYWTSWVDERGEIHFQKDVYKKDRAILRML